MAISELRAITKKELDEAIEAHSRYLNGKSGAKRMVFNNCDLSGAIIRNCDLRDADFTGSRLDRADLSGSNLKSAAFFSADLRRANLKYCNMARTDLRGALFNGADLTYADLSEADMREGVVARRDKHGELEIVAHAPMATSSCDTSFRNAKMNNAKMGGIIAVAADFSGAMMRDVKLVRAHLKQAKMVGTDLSNSDLSGANLEGANLEGAVLAGANTYCMKTAGANLSNVLKEPPKVSDSEAKSISDLVKNHILWRKTMGEQGKAGVFDGMDLRPAFTMNSQPLTAFRAKAAIMFGMDLSFSELQGAVLTGSDMRLIDLQNCDMRGINLSECKLQRADFKKAILGPLILPDGREFPSDLRNADLTYADLTGVDLTKVRLDGADLTGAILDGTKILPSVIPLIKTDDNLNGLDIAL